MRTYAWSLVVLAIGLVCTGCGGGGSGADGAAAEGSGEEVLALWTFDFDSGSTTDFSAVSVGFAEFAITLRDSLILAEDLADGDTGLQARVEATEGGPPFGDLAAALTDGLDSELSATLSDATGLTGRILRESEHLTPLVAADSDLAGFEITAFQLELSRIEIGPDTRPPTELRIDRAPGTRRATRARVEGAIRILGRPLE